MEEKKAVCGNPWCRAHYYYTSEECPGQCNKCISFDTELSGGVTWTNKKYEGSRFDGMPHPISINVDRAIDKKKNW